MARLALPIPSKWQIANPFHMAKAGLRYRLQLSGKQVQTADVVCQRPHPSNRAGPTAAHPDEVCPYWRAVMAADMWPDGQGGGIGAAPTSRHICEAPE